jgi:hypothetical protein
MRHGREARPHGGNVPRGAVTPVPQAGRVLASFGIWIGEGWVIPRDVFGLRSLHFDHVAIYLAAHDRQHEARFISPVESARKRKCKAIRSVDKSIPITFKRQNRIPLPRGDEPALDCDFERSQFPWGYSSHLILANTASSAALIGAKSSADH